MRFTVTLLLMTAGPLLQAAEAPETGYWSLNQAREVLDKTRHVYIDPNLDGLTAGERVAIDKLIAAGQLLHELYLDSLIPKRYPPAGPCLPGSPGTHRWRRWDSCSICSGAR